MRIDRRSFLSLFARLLPAKLVTDLWLARPAHGTLYPAQGTPAQASDQPDEVRFLVVGDWGRNGRHHQRDVAAQMAQVARQRRCRFVISVGDNFYEDGVQSADDPQWRASFEDVYAAPELQVPWYSLLGNHDYRGRPDAQLAYAKRQRRWRMPARYYTAVEPLTAGQAVRFFFLDTSPFVTAYRQDRKMAGEIGAQDVEAQLRWLDQSLGRSGEAWRIVVGHHPVYSGGEHGTTPELVERLLPVLRKHQIQLYLSGHDHDLQHLVRDGLHCFVSGAGSQVREAAAVEGTRFARGVPGFLAVSLSVERVRAEFFDLHGTSLYRADVLPQAGALRGT
jgi:tartrate-resistant acid phosphatase type 5